MNGFDQGSTWKDLVYRVINGNGANNRWPNPGRIRLGGWRNLEETSKGEVSALLLYNSELPDSDRRDVEFYLANHWNMSNDLDFDFNRKLKLLQGSDFYTLQISEQNDYQNALTYLRVFFMQKSPAPINGS